MSISERTEAFLVSYAQSLDRMRRFPSYPVHRLIGVFDLPSLPIDHSRRSAAMDSISEAVTVECDPLSDADFACDPIPV